MTAILAVGSGALLGVMDCLNKPVEIWGKYFAWSLKFRINNFFCKSVASFVITLQLFFVNTTVANPRSVQDRRDVGANQTQFCNGIVNLSQRGPVKVVNFLGSSSLNSISLQLVHQEQKLSFLGLYVENPIPANGEQVDNKPTGNSNNERETGNDQSYDWEAGFRMLKWWHWVLMVIASLIIGLTGPVSWYVITGYELRSRQRHLTKKAEPRGTSDMNNLEP